MAVGPTIELRFEEEHVAKSGVQGLDILGSGVRVSRPLGDPSAIDSLAVRVELPDGVVLPSSPNQRIAPDPAGGVRITLQRGPGAQVTEDERADALGKDAIIDWGHEEIGAKAREITAAAKTPRARADAIGTWVYRTLDKRLATHLPSASTVLTRRVGDCTEHAWLFTALARAVGLPTRPVYGLAYAGDKEQTFAYHAWVEVEIDGRWVPVDPTWNERVADATHLKLGSDLAQVGAALGGLTLEVVDP